jgi:serine phosphatase RsbU (regulator of sigma subunit)
MIKKHLVLFFLLLCILSAHAQERVFVIDSVGKEVILNDATYFYEDKTNTLTFAEVGKANFKPYKKPTEAPNPKYSYWFKITLVNQNKIQTVFSFQAISKVHFGALCVLDKHQKLIKKAQIGMFLPYSQRTWGVKENAFPFQIAYQDTLTIFAKIQPYYMLERWENVVLGLPTNEHKLAFLNFQLFFQGAVWLMCFYNLLFFFMMRDRAYLYYALYIMSMGTVSIEDAHASLEEYPYQIEWAVTLAALFLTFFYTQFIRYFLNIPQFNPKLNQFCSISLRTQVVLLLIATIFYINVPQKIISTNFVAVFFLFDIGLGLWLIYASWQKQKSLATYILLGYLAMTVPLAVAILKQIVGNGANPETDGVLVQMGVLGELIVFSLGLGYRSQKAEQERIEALQENQRIIEEQNEMLEEKVEERTNELNKQKEAVEEQNKSIMENINYARRIQEAFLPKNETIGKYLQEFFILFKPRDVVSGDFYFVEEVAGKVVVGAIDCTGHGVSGAFMTMLGNDILHNLVDNQQITNPDFLLNELHKGVRQALKQAETENRDGMDAVLLTFDKENKKVQYAGAKNPLIYIQNNELHLIKADKMPIGGEQREQERVFTKHEIDITSPTMFYLFSDGFQDQFGGEQNKKFGIARMKELFLQIHTLPLLTQQTRLNEAFETWREQAGEKQIDDVLVVGIRVGE